MRRNMRLAGLAVALLMALGTTSQATMFDLTTSNEVTVNGGVFTTNDVHSTGTGNIQPFLRVHDQRVEEGYNSNYRPNEFDQDMAWNAALPLNLVPIVTIGGVDYKEFLLDINQNNNAELSLDILRIYQSNNADLHGYGDGTAWTGPAVPLVYELGSAPDSPGGPPTANWIKMLWDLPGSGWGDVWAYIPASSFSGAFQYVHLYSRFGDHFEATDGFEEWAVEGTTPIVPVPAAVVLGMLGMGAAGWRLRKFA